MTSSGDFPKIDGDVFYALDAHKVFGVLTGFEQLSLSATSTTSSVTFASKRQFVTLHNSGTKTVYINFDAAATTSSFTILPGERWSFWGVTEAIHGICGGSDTTTVRIIGQGSTSAAVSNTVGVLACTATTASVALPASVYLLTIRNTGVNVAYINFDSAALTTHFQVDAGDSIQLTPVGTSTLHAICAATKTTTLNFVAAARW